MNQSLIKGKYRPEIDGLRAFAVVAVIINHFNEELLPSGYLGVDIFFVISGYVITSSLSGRESKNFWDFISSFYERRIRRLVPALVFCVLITSFFVCLFNLDPKVTLRTGITSLFGLSNLYLLRQSTDYFAQSTELNAFTHTWSLGVEEQFYFLFPFIIWFTGFGRQKVKSSRNLFIAVLSLTIFSLIAFISLYSTNQPAAYFLMPTRFWEMATGCLVFIALNKRVLIIKRLEKTSPIFVLIGMVGVLFFPISFAVLSTILIVVMSAILISCLREGTSVFTFFTKEKIVYLGLISYSLYLWHWGVLSISRWTIGIYWWSVPFQVGLILLMSVFSYKFIESPLRRNSFNSARYQIIGFNILGLFSSAFTLFLFNTNSHVMFSGANKSFPADNSWGNRMRSATDEINGKKCFGKIPYSEEKINNLLANCIIINPKNKDNRTFAFVGDSHMLAIMNAQKLIYEKANNLIHYSFASCPFPYPRYGLLPKGCDKFLQKSAASILKRLNEGDYVVILNYHLSHLGDNSLDDVRHKLFNESGELPSNGYIKRDIYIQSLFEFVDKADSKGIKIIFIGAGMRNNNPIFSIKEWFRPFPLKSTYQQEKSHAMKLNSYFGEQFKDKKNIIFFDPIKELSSCCNEDKIFMKYFRDSNHYSDYGAEVLIKKIIPIVSSFENS